ncbi:sulfotransferase domain-containing protein [Actinomadura sp. DC4]|uniref:sulfotransferase domain-containing protein n=1 Tax=Actinomadura sp. DC4 TaxID=3055069 RepID=UPI0025B0AC55|nr:sulfotransferase domain-containing protein [Actinomadura sp. DC4]MDN3357651.1 sulfotransferase domain-containing protein [Actinomadura sp. DC4]
MTEEIRQYQSPDYNSARWANFPLRDGDIIVSAPPKSGTTWAQTMCALLIFQTPDLPQPLRVLSPWLDQLRTPQEEVYARFAEQKHRRVIKTHTPLDGLPSDPRVSYIVIARHPLDRALSFYHQSANIDLELLFQDGSDPKSRPLVPPPPSVREWLQYWCLPQPTDDQGIAVPSSLHLTVHHLYDAWNRRTQPNVRLLHYVDLCADLAGEMAALAEWLGITVKDSVWPDLVKAATFDEMKSRAEQLAPTATLKDPVRFFRSGRSGGTRDILTEDDLDAYRKRVGQLAPKPFLDWLHRDPPVIGDGAGTDG